jgi:transposase InsO family protein
MSKEQEEKKAQQIMDFRYAIIAELLNPYLSQTERRGLMREKADRQYEIPYSNRTRVSYECIRKWYTTFGRFGKEGLRPKLRSDKGICRVVSPEEQASLLQYLEQNPELTAKSAYRTLQERGVLHTDISKSALSRLVLAAGLDRQNRLRSKVQTQQLKFAFKYPLECVQADMMHSFELPDEKGKRRRTILLVVLDDATRRVVYADFSFRESSLEFECALRHVLLTHGRIGRIFVDNGSAFVSSETLRILSILGIPLIHSRVGYAASRGKVERHFRTVRDQFLRPLDKLSVRSLADLNARFHTWLESEYHRSPHRGLGGKTPLEAWLEKAYHIIHLDPTVDLDEIFKHEVRRRVYSDCTFTLYGILYEVPVVLKGKIIKVRFNPLQAVRKLQLFYEKHSYGEARVVDTYANTRVKRTHNNDPDSGLSKRDQAGRHPKHPTAAPTRAAFSASKLDLHKGEQTP